MRGDPLSRYFSVISDTVATRPPRVREAWVDTAKGIAIILVVLYHAAIYSDYAGIAGVWGPLSMLLASFRMPLFFFTAGIFAAKAIDLPFRDLFRRRIARLLWLYVLWSLIFLAAFQFLPLIGDTRPTVLEFLAIPVRPNDSTWFLYGLALFFAAAWGMKRWPLWLQFLPPVVLALLFGMNLLTTGSGPLDRMCTYFVFFLLAVRGGLVVRRIAPRIKVWHTLLLVALFLVTTAVVYPTSLINIPGTRLIANLCAIAGGVSLAVVLARSPLFGWLRVLGGRTLPVYLAHFYPILVICALLPPVAPVLEPVSVLIPPALTVVAIIVSLGLHRLTVAVPGLWALPRRWEQAKAPVLLAGSAPGSSD